MKKERFIVKKVSELLAKKQSPAILCGVTVAGILVTGVMAYRSGLKAHDILEEKIKEKEELKRDREEKLLTKKEIAKENVEFLWETTKELAPVVAPPVIMGVVTAACAIGGNRISNKRVAVLSAAYAVTKDALSETNNKLVEMLGAGKAKQIKDEIVKDKLKRNPSTRSEIIQTTGKGNQLFKDMKFGTTFRSNINAVEQGIVELSAKCMNEQYVTLDEFYDILNLEHIGFGSYAGWSYRDTAGGKLPISLTALYDEFYGEVVMCMDYDIGVTKRVYNFDDWY